MCVVCAFVCVAWPPPDSLFGPVLCVCVRCLRSTRGQPQLRDQRPDRRRGGVAVVGFVWRELADGHRELTTNPPSSWWLAPFDLIKGFALRTLPSIRFRAETIAATSRWARGGLWISGKRITECIAPRPLFGLTLGASCTHSLGSLSPGMNESQTDR